MAADASVIESLVMPKAFAIEQRLRIARAEAPSLGNWNCEALLRFELSPPHTHNRAANAGYLLFFMAGTAIAYLADLAEQLSARPPT